MDFGTLLHVAKKNNESIKNSESKYYSTKFSAPKKESKEKTLSENIKKFLAKKEQEEREKARIEKEKRDRLLAMRDEKSKNKIKKMLKVIKSANKSVLDDAVDNENTAVTLHGPDQPDEDDYGYVSQEAAAFYKKYMDKVKSLPEDNKFATSRPVSKNDLSGTKDRVRAAILKEQEEKNNPIRSKSKQSQSSAPSATTVSSTPSTVPTQPSSSHRKKDLYDPTVERDLEEKKRREDEQKKSKLKKPAPPPLDFKELLKLAEKKQHEPVEIVVEPKKEPERLLTKKEKKELEERQKYLEEKERRKKEAQMNPHKSQMNGKIPKIDPKDPSLAPKKSPSDKSMSNASSTQKSSSSGVSVTPSKDGFKKPPNPDQQVSHKLANTSKSKINADQKNNNLPVNSFKQKPEELSKYPPSGYSKPSTLSTANGLKPSPKPGMTKPSIPVSKSTGALSSSKANQSSSMRQNAPKDIQTSRKPLQNDKDIKPRQFPPTDLQRSRQFPPPDVRGGKPLKKAPKRRILDDDDEYDSELDDFIDDGPEEDQSYSNYIKEIFGYDKSRYRELDEDDDDAAMESTFAQQMKEEYVSKKIGLMEDLEDMRLEAEEKKKKALMKKRKLK